jgi:hypothetical protein
MARSNETVEVEVVPVELPDALRYQRSEARMSTTLPASLTTSSGEVIPGLLADLSPTGVMVVLDRRFSPQLPMPIGTSLSIEFYLDEVEVTGATIRVRGVKDRGRFQLELGCSFVDLSDRARTMIRSKVAAAKIARPR